MTGDPPIKVALTGFGSVGQSLARILVENRDLPLQIVLAADRQGYALDHEGLDPSELLVAKASGSVAEHGNGREGPVSADTLIESGASFLLELATTSYADGEPGTSYVKAAFDAGLHVVLASKGPLVAHWDQLFGRAREAGLRVGYSATHGAPLPIIDLGRRGLAGSRIRGIRALFNSTTGLLLEQMETGKSLEEAVNAISDGGVAETNPRLDIEGWDAAAKCVIVGRSLFAGSLTLDSVERQGIENLTTDEVITAARAGTPIKLVCTIEPDGDGIRAAVRPTRLQTGDPLSHLRNGDLGVIFDAHPMGPLFLASSGAKGGTHGAGGTPTAASVIRDVLNINAERRS